MSTRADMLPAAVLAALADRITCADALDALARSTGDGRFARAAGVLRAGLGGRPCRDDDASLDLMVAMMRDGTARSAEAAAAYVARTLPGEHSAAAAAARLTRKFRARARRDENSSDNTKLYTVQSHPRARNVTVEADRLSGRLS